MIHFHKLTGHTGVFTGIYTEKSDKGDKPLYDASANKVEYIRFYILVAVFCDTLKEYNQ